MFGDAACAKYGYDRAAIDGFSAESARRAQAAQAAGAPTDAEITPVTVKTRKGEVVIAKDEEPGKIDLNKIPELRAAFGKDGVLTAASSSKISDGAAALVVMSADAAAAAGIKPLARIKAHATHAQAPEWFTTAPVAADCERAGQGRLERGRRGFVRNQQKPLLAWRWRRWATSAFRTTN